MVNMMVLSNNCIASSTCIVLILCIFIEMDNAQTLPSDLRRVGNSNDFQTLLRPKEIAMTDDYYYHDYDGDYDEVAPGKEINF